MKLISLLQFFTAHYNIITLATCMSSFQIGSFTWVTFSTPKIYCMFSYCNISCQFSFPKPAKVLNIVCLSRLNLFKLLYIIFKISPNYVLFYIFTRDSSSYITIRICILSSIILNTIYYNSIWLTSINSKIFVIYYIALIRTLSFSSFSMYIKISRDSLANFGDLRENKVMAFSVLSLIYAYSSSIKWIIVPWILFWQKLE